MSATAGQMLVSVRDRCACVRIAGRVNFACSPDFKTLLNELSNRGCTTFVLDLSECVLMDSTFLGVLAGFGLKCQQPQPDQPERTLEVFNPSDRVAELLETLGVLHLFKVIRGAAALPATPEAQPLTPGSHSREELNRTCLEAHQLLMAANPANAARFKDVVAFLAEDLKKQPPGR